MNRILLAVALSAFVPCSSPGAHNDSARSSLSLAARVLGADGRPAKASITFWREVEDGGVVELPDHFQGMSERAQRWHDRASGKTWAPIYHYGMGDTATLGRLAPGAYRVTAALSNGPAPFGISGVIQLDGKTSNTEVGVRLLTGPALTVSAVDERSQKPLPRFQAMLFRDDGFPITRWSMSPWAVWAREPEGQLVFSQLAPGDYRLEVRCPAFYADQPEYRLKNGPLEIRVVAGEDRRIVAPLEAVALPEDAIRERWPFVVTGRVTDGRGKGLEGVTIIAHCGMGTLLPTGQATTGLDGRYTLRFAGGMRMRSGDTWGVGVQAATISPGKPGYVEANLHRQGDLLMADTMPGPNEDTGWKVNPAKVVLPEQPFPLDFVLLPAATLKGRLVDAGNRPLAAERIYLAGPELPPSSSVLADATTDADGRFHFDNVPPRRAWWLSLPSHRDVRSQAMTFERPGEHQVLLRRTGQADKPVLELTRAGE